MLIHNAALADEVSALNAIYGDGLIVASFSDDHHTTLSLKLPAFDFSFLLRVFDDYPRSPPDMLGVDDLVESLKPGVQQCAVYLGACIRAVHYPESVCLFDAIEEFESIYRSLQPQIQHNDDLDVVLEHEPANKAEILRDLALRARAKTDVKSAQKPAGDSLFDIVDCSSCLEPFFRVNTANLKCKHSFCDECLREGVVSSFKSRSELTCCGQSVPIKVIQQHCGFEDEFMEAFRLWLQEHNAPNPTYCPWEDCLAYIPRRFIRDDYTRCPFCERAMCMLCKKKDHSGVCRQDKKLKALIEKSKWKFCPCGQLVEKKHGCNHMTCRCSREFCYRCGKPYDIRTPTCSCGLFA